MVEGEDSAESLSASVVQAVAAREGVGPTDLPARLFDVIDPDALDSLFIGSEGHVTFPFCGYDVTVHADGEVTVADSI